MTDEQEAAAIELTRRVAAEFLDQMSIEWDAAGHGPASNALRQLAKHLENSDPGTILVLRETVQVMADFSGSGAFR